MSNYTLNKIDAETYETVCGTFAIYHRSELHLDADECEGEWLAFETCGCGELLEAWGETVREAYKGLKAAAARQGIRITCRELDPRQHIPTLPTGKTWDAKYRMWL